MGPKIPLVKATQSVVLETVQAIRSLGLPQLGPDFSRLHGTDLHQSLVAYRASKKYEQPNAANSSRRRESSINKFLDTNASLDPGFSCWDLDERDRLVFLRARLWLADLLKGFRPTYGYAFPSGETFISNSGMTDLYWKLREESQWTVSLDALTYAARVAYHTHALKRVVKERFRSVQPLWRSVLRSWYRENSAHPQLGFLLFKKQFAYCCDIVGCSRVTTVPKDNQWDRVITCEPTWNMVAQLSLALDLRERLRQKTGIDITVWQGVHKSLIRSGRATIDFKEASDRNRWSVVKQLFPEGVVKHLQRLRNTAFAVSDEYHAVNMLAPMGCGFTFDMLTLTLLAYSRQFDPAATVFGDDVIISKDAAPDFITFVEKLGWIVNHTKSFTDGNFRESCGAFADLTRDALLESYDWVWPQDEPSCYILANKISRTIRALRPCSVRSLLVECHEKLANVFPRDSFVEDVGGPLEDWLFFSEEEGSTSANTSPAVQNWCHMWQRPVRLRSRVTYHAASLSVKICKDHSTLACFLRRGASYSPPLGKFKERRTTCDVYSAATLSSVTLVSVL